MANLPGNSTIDYSNDPELNAARAANPQSLQHTDVGSCATNLLAANPVKVILGHGCEGKIVTGSGTSGIDRLKHISLWNQDVWETPLGAIQNCTFLHLYACRTGAGLIGSNFLYRLAQLLNATVLAPIGDVYVNTTNGAITIEGGWKEATPNHWPDPVGPPPPPQFIEIGPMTNLLLKTANGFQLVALSSISEVNLRYVGKGSTWVTSTVPVPFAPLPPGGAAIFLSFIAFDRPFSPPGAPLAVKTADFTLKFGNTVREFSILDNRLVHDKTFPEIYYYCKPGFGNLLS